MTQRIAGNRATYNDAPFSGDGASLYVATAGATSIRYRNLRVVGGGSRRSGLIKGRGGVHDVAADPVAKTNRVASVTSPDTFTSGNVYAIPVAHASTTMIADVRIHADDVENLGDNYRTFSVELDANRDPVTAILGTAKMIGQDVRAGGVVIIRFRYDKSLDGVQPNRFNLQRTAGPSSPTDIAVVYAGTEQFVQITTGALLDTSAYTFDIEAEDTVTGTTLTVITGLSVAADASGPVAPINGSTSTK